MTKVKSTLRYAWLSGFIAAVGVAHAIPFIVRHKLEIAGRSLEDQTSLIVVLLSVGASIYLARRAELRLRSQ